MKVIPRRLFDEDKPDGYLESDNDYVRNNIEAAVRLLDAEVKRQRGLAAVVPK